MPRYPDNAPEIAARRNLIHISRNATWGGAQSSRAEEKTKGVERSGDGGPGAVTGPVTSCPEEADCTGVEGMAMPKPTDELRASAYHEAGHAVAFRRFWPGERPGTGLTIDPADDDHCSHARGDISLEGPPEELEKQASYACAGYAAVRAVGYSEMEAVAGCRTDFWLAGRATTRALEVVKREAVEMMRRPENLHAVARIATELLRQRRIDARRLDALVESSLALRARGGGGADGR